MCDYTLNAGESNIYRLRHLKTSFGADPKKVRIKLSLSLEVFCVCESVWFAIVASKYDVHIMNVKGRCQMNELQLNCDKNDT